MPILRQDSSFAFVALMFFSGSLLTSNAQVNSWTKPTSGNWEEMYWSLGMLPGPGQQVMITNAGWKAVQIGWGTSQNHTQSLDVQSIVVSSPVDSFNTLLLNYSGFQTPLSVNRSLIVASNSALTMLSSALQLGWTHGEGLSVGGQVNQNDSAEVIGGQLDVGWIGPGVYNLNSGFLNVYDGWVGGPQGGVFNQNGGTNSSRITSGRWHLQFKRGRFQFGGLFRLLHIQRHVSPGWRRHQSRSKNLSWHIRAKQRRGIR